MTRLGAAAARGAIGAGRRPLLALLLALALTPAVASQATAATWTDRQLPGEAATMVLFGISCPSTSLCVAVGSGNTIAASTNPTGGPASWGVANVGSGSNGQPNQREIRGVSCPSTQLCVAVSFEGLIYTSTNPTGNAAAWAVTDLDGPGPSTHLYGVSCPSPSFCAAAAGGGKIVTSTNPTGGAAAWSTTQLEGPLELRGISCPSPALCVAVGDDGDGIRPKDTDNGQVISSTNPLGGVWQRGAMPGAQGTLYGVSCPSPALCVSGNRIGNLLVSTAPTGPASAWTAVDGGGTVQITDTDCVSPSLCVAVDNNSDVLTSTDPTGGAAAWTFTNLVPFPGVDGTAANALWGVACPAVSLCAIAGAAGQIFTSEDPFAASPVPPVKKDKKQRKRPRVTIASHPNPGTELRGRKLTARFRFFARHHVKVRGFACKIDKRPLKRCRSPKGYRVGFGKHVFRVRAIGRTGLKGPPAVARFKVCHPSPVPECVHLPPPTA
jgi:hypothetical protein